MQGARYFPDAQPAYTLTQDQIDVLYTLGISSVELEQDPKWLRDLMVETAQQIKEKPEK